MGLGAIEIVAMEKTEAILQQESWKNRLLLNVDAHLRITGARRANRASLQEAESAHKAEMDENALRAVEFLLFAGIGR